MRPIIICFYYCVSCAYFTRLFDWMLFWSPLRMLHLFGDLTLAEDQASARRVGLWVGRDLYRVIPVLTRDLGLHVPPPGFCRLWRQQISTGKFHSMNNHRSSIYRTINLYPLVLYRQTFAVVVIYMYICMPVMILMFYVIICKANGVVSEDEFSSFITNVSIIFFFTNINTKQLS